MKVKSRRWLSLIVITILTLSVAQTFVNVQAIEAITVTPAGPYRVGDIITVTGYTGLVTSGSTVEVYWDIVTGPDARLLNTTTGNPDGSYEVEVTIPETTSGNHYIWVKYSTGETAKCGPLQISPILSISPDTGLPGDIISLEGHGFDGESQFNVSISNSTQLIQIIDGTGGEETDAFGSFSVEFSVPAGWSYGVYYVNVSDSLKTYVMIEFGIGASVALSPSYGPRGTVVTILGRGFSRDGTIRGITIDGVPLDIVGDEIPIGSEGSFTTEITIGNLPYGERIVNVTDDVYWDTATFVVVHNKLDVTINAPQSVSIGSIVEIDGRLHWDNGSAMADARLLVEFRLLYGSQWNELSSPKTDVNGSFVFQWIPPATGEYLIGFDLWDESVEWVDENKIQFEILVDVIADSVYLMNLSAGWNMISSYNVKANASDIFPGFYQLVTWDGSGYKAVTRMEPGKGYWALVLEDTQIKFPPT